MALEFDLLCVEGIL